MKSIRERLWRYSRINEVSSWNGHSDGGKSRFNEFIQPPHNSLKLIIKLLCGINSCVFWDTAMRIYGDCLKTAIFCLTGKTIQTIMIVGCKQQHSVLRLLKQSIQQSRLQEWIFIGNIAHQQPGRQNLAINSIKVMWIRCPFMRILMLSSMLICSNTCRTQHRDYGNGQSFASWFALVLVTRSGLLEHWFNCLGQCCFREQELALMWWWLIHLNFCFSGWISAFH